MRKLTLLIAMVSIFIILNPMEAQTNKPMVTFIELGSDKCIPCKKMQPILKSIEKKYREQIKVVFYDVWKDEYKSKSDEYKIKLIPTQIFLDANGKEIFRHEGYYPEAQIDKFLQSKGLKVRK
jgi:thioredoxin 1